MPKDTYSPDILSKFTLFRDKFEELSNYCTEEYGENAKVTFELDLLWARCLDLHDDIESLACGTYD